jgi:hypothetical protein
MSAPDGAGQEAGVGRKVFVGADIDQGRRICRADQPNQLVR